jgi:hypothetical protein
MGATPQGVPQGIEVLAQRERIDLLDPLAEGSLPSLREDPRGQQLSLVGFWKRRSSPKREYGCRD